MNRFLVSVAVLAFVAEMAVAEGQVCVPNSKFMDDCNTCQCSPDGTKAWCTRMACEPKRAKRSNNECTHGEVKKIECNTCVCSYGTWGCSRMMCVDKREVKQFCEPNSKFKQSCNTCICNDKGTNAACTLKFCLEDLPRSKREVAKSGLFCEPNTTYKQSCNTCICNDKGTNAACTLKFCIEDFSRSKRETIKTYCVPKSYFKQNCNQCHCNDYGTAAACTLKICEQNEPNFGLATRYRRETSDCEPKSVFVKDCNTCVCNDQGTNAFCTKRQCLTIDTIQMTRYRRSLSEESNENQLVKRNPQSCVPNSVYKKDCNTCKCSNDGTMEFCTRKMCIPRRQRRDEPAVDEFTEAVQNGNQVCNPGDVKTEDCNRCKCANNGIGWFCTRNTCGTNNNHNNNNNNNHAQTG